MESRFPGSRAPALVIPKGVDAGDYAVVIHYQNFNIGGGSGAAWTSTALILDGVVEHRTLLPGDLINPLPFSVETPYAAAFFRTTRPVQGLTLRTSLSYSGLPFTREMAGFEKSDDILALVGVTAMSVGGFVSLEPKEWTSSVLCGEDQWQASLHTRDRPGAWLDDAPFHANTNISASSKSAAVFELH